MCPRQLPELARVLLNVPSRVRTARQQASPLGSFHYLGHQVQSLCGEPRVMTLKLTDREIKQILIFY